MHAQLVQTPNDKLAAPISPEAETAQPRPRAALLSELRKVANGNPGEFWIWWFMLSKKERREVLNQVEAA